MTRNSDPKVTDRAISGKFRNLECLSVETTTLFMGYESPDKGAEGQDASVGAKEATEDNPVVAPSVHPFLSG